MEIALQILLLNPLEKVPRAIPTSNIHHNMAAVGSPASLRPKIKLLV
jgi:hypothetical protein